MRNSRIKAKLSKNQPVLLTSLHYSDPSLYEMTSLMGFDGIWLDLEHHHHSVETANTLLRAARVGSSDVMVRPAKGEFMRMGRILEAGATGIMYPRCDNAAEAREVVRWSKFAPMGQRGIDAANPDNPYCLMPLVEYLKAANEQTFIVIQIEDPSALAQVDEIAAVPGVDIIFFGPGDFSILSGIPGQRNIHKRFIN
ncbi:MAG: HpcH/HpaI aldolase family protein [Planctomycetaceae bacterium]